MKWHNRLYRISSGANWLLAKYLQGFVGLLPRLSLIDNWIIRCSNVVIQFPCFVLVTFSNVYGNIAIKKEVFSAVSLLKNVFFFRRIELLRYFVDNYSAVNAAPSTSVNFEANDNAWDWPSPPIFVISSFGALLFPVNFY